MECTEKLENVEVQERSRGGPGGVNDAEQPREEEIAEG